MRIGIDIDGVLTDIEQWQLDYGSKYFNKKVINPKGYETYEIFNISEKEDNMFWEEYLFEYVTKEKSRKFADEIIEKLKNEGNEIYIITARYLTNEDSENGNKMRDIVKEWLNINNIQYDKLIFSPEDKLEICLANKIDIMIEDKKENINQISNNIPVICFNAGYNETCQNKNIYRVYTWYDVYLVINNLNDKENN